MLCEKNMLVVLCTHKHESRFFWMLFITSLCTICIFICFFSNQFCFNEYLSFFCTTLLWFFVRHIQEFRNLKMSTLTSWYGTVAANFFEKIQYDQKNSCAHLFRTSSACYNYSFHPSRGIHCWCRKKVVWIFRVSIH